MRLLCDFLLESHTNFLIISNFCFESIKNSLNFFFPLNQFKFFFHVLTSPHKIFIDKWFECYQRVWWSDNNWIQKWFSFHFHQQFHCFNPFRLYVHLPYGKSAINVYVCRADYNDVVGIRFISNNKWFDTVFPL